VKGLNERVSVRDAHGPVDLLAPLNVVGTGTHPDATHEDYARVIALVRKTPTLASLTVYTPRVSAGTRYGARQYTRTLWRVSDYVTRNDAPVEDTSEATHVSKVSTVSKVSEARLAALATPDVARMAAVVGYVGDVN
jgi:hypothetical protein